MNLDLSGCRTRESMTRAAVLAENLRRAFAGEPGCRPVRLSMTADGRPLLLAAGSAGSQPSQQDRYEMTDEVRRLAGMVTVSELQQAAEVLQKDELAWREETAKRISAAVKKLIDAELQRRTDQRTLTDDEVRAIASEIVQRKLDEATKQLDIATQ